MKSNSGPLQQAAQRAAAPATAGGLSAQPIHGRDDGLDEADVVGRCAQAMQAAMESDPVWAASFDATDIFVCERQLLATLLSTAPNAFAAGVLFGVFSMRQEVAQITERPFE